MDMCPLHNNYIGENTSCPACAKAKVSLPANVNLLAVLERKNRMIADLIDEMRVRGYYYKIMKWTAVAGWVCVILLLAYGHRL